MAQNGFTDYSGETINGYQVEKIVLHHLVSTRYLAKNKKAEPVYLEILNVASDKDAEMDGRFQERMKLLQQRNFTGVAPVLDVGHTTQDHAYAVIQYAPGLTLARQLADWREKGSRLPIQSALSLVQKIAVILGEVYADDLYHADLCPENIVLGDDDELVLYGLGIPYQPQPSQPIKQVQMLDYLSPEQWQGRAISDRSNIYSLGVILYELLVGHRPEIPQSSWDIFERTTLPKETPLEEARSGLSEETYSLVKTCLWRQEWSRYETVSELIEAIVSAQQAEVLWQQRRQSAFQIPRWLYFAAPALLFLIVLAIMLSSRRSGDGGVATAVPTINTAVNQTQEATPVTIEPPTPTPTDQPIPVDQIVLLAPTDGFQFSQEDMIIFDWVWSEPLKDNQRFVVKQVTGDEA
ncbi:MAG: protein kinase, partial [Anaerolineae bacterium]